MAGNISALKFNPLGWPNPPAALRYGAAVLSVVAAVGILSLMEDNLRAAAHVSLFLGAVMFSTWFGGARPGLLALALSIPAFDYFFLLPVYSLAVDARQLPRLLLYVVLAFFVWSVSVAARRAREALRLAHDGLQRNNEALRAENSERRKAEEALKESQQLLQLVLATLTVGVTVTDRAGDILLVNDASKRIWDGMIVSGPERRARTRAFWHDSGERIAPADWASARALSEGQTSLDELIDVETYDGWQKTIRNSAAPIRDAQGLIVGAVVVNEDVTERVRAEEALRRSEEHLRLVIDTIPIMAWSVRPDGTVDFVNQPWLDYAGLSLEEFLEQPTGAVHPEDLPPVMKKWRADMTDGKLFEYEMRLRRADGEYRWSLIRTAPLRDEQSNIVKWYGVAIDIEERKQAVDALRRSEDHLRLVTDTIPALIFCTLPDGSLNYINQRHREFTGLSLDDVRGWRWTALIHPEDRAQIVDEWRAALATGEPIETEARLKRATGDYRWLLIRAVPLRDEMGKIVKWYGTKTDIEDRKQAEERLRQIERELWLVIDTIPANAWRARSDGAVDFTNQRLLEDLGFSYQDLIGWNWTNILHPEDGTDFMNKWHAALASGEAMESEARVRRADGEYRWFLIRNVPLSDDTGNITRWYGTGMDITERKRAEEELRRSEGRARLIIHTIPVMAWTLRPDGTVDFLNQRWLDYAGLTWEQYMADPTSPVHPSDFSRALEYGRARMALGEAWEDELRLRRADGEYRWFLVRTAPLRDESGKVINWYGVSTDITERKQAEEMLQTFSQRLIEAQEAERRRVARELHDEIGQALTAIKLNLQAGKHSAETSPLASQLHESIGIVDRALEQVRSLAFNLRPSLLDDLGLIAALRWYVDQEARRAGLISQFVVDISETHLPPELATACFRIVQEALTNVVRHAQASHVWVELRQSGAELHLVVRDDGIGFGMSAVRGHYASDESLGLQGMQERALILGGKIEIKSAPTQGTEVHVRFPLATVIPTLV